MKENERNVVKLSNEELAKVVGGAKSDVPTVTSSPGGPSFGPEWDNGTPGVTAPCGKNLHYAEESCSEPVKDRTKYECPTCSHNH